MTRYFGFLRGVNLGNHNIKMADLRSRLEELGYEEVETFIASGNVIFEVPGRPKAADVEAEIEAHLAKAYGYEVPTFLRTDAQLKAVDDHVPFDGWEEASGHTFHVGFLRSKPTKAVVEEVEALETEIDRLTIEGRELYWMIRGGFSETKVTRGAPDEQVGEVTVRNVKTVRRLVDKYLG